MPRMDLPSATAYVARLHAVVDELTAPLAARLGGRLQCRSGCAACCVDDLTVFEVEAARIRADFPQVLTEAPRPPGACAFLDEAGACRIYAARPYVCRTQGLPLRWIEQRRGQPVERRDICPLNEPGLPLTALSKDDCWSLGPVEERLRLTQEALDGGEGRRVALRDLFTESPASRPSPGA